VRHESQVSEARPGAPAAAFGTSSPEVWLRMQAQYDLWQLGKRNIIRVDPLPHLQHS
jgi:hypothetical protein